ncbi:MAG: hypothetical protein P0121_11615 [Nitrospira sp.]|nr:hypothetical protein [Nitrospira sp.]
MLIISIQNQAHVGNDAVLYPMQAECVVVAAVPSALSSNQLRCRLAGRVMFWESLF